MTPGIILIIVGAVFAFALRADASWLDTRALGVILMLGGAAFVWRSRVRRREVTTTREVEAPDEPGGRTEERTVTERRVE